jgi:hypothetical protein
VIQVDGHRNGGALGGRPHRRHRQIGVEEPVMGLGEAQYDRGALGLGPRQDRLNEIQADQIEGTDRAAIAIGMAQHVAHIHQHLTPPDRSRLSRQWPKCGVTGPECLLPDAALRPPASKRRA